VPLPQIDPYAVEIIRMTVRVYDSTTFVQGGIGKVSHISWRRSGSSDGTIATLPECYSTRPDVEETQLCTRICLQLEMGVSKLQIAFSSVR
jgi:hypothetical protein